MILAAIASLLLCLGALPTAAQGPQDSGSIRFSRTAFRDPAAGDVEALVMLVPQGWQATGAVQWTPAWARPAQLKTYVEDPGTGLSIDWLPIADFIWFEVPAGLEMPIGANYLGSAYVPPILDPVQFVQQFWVPSVLDHLRGLQPVSQRQEPQIAEEFIRGFGGPARAAAYVLRYEFDTGGQAWEQDVSFALLDASANGVTSWYVNFAHTVAGPRGMLDAHAGLISAVIASRITTPEWEAAYRLVQQLFYQGLQQQMADTAAFGRALTQYRAEIAALQDQVTQERQASQDRIAGYQRDVLGGVENYDDPVNGGIVQLPSGWRDYWVNPQGDYITSGDPGFDPNTPSDPGWQRLQLRTR